MRPYGRLREAVAPPGMEGYMGRSHDSQAEFFQKLGDGSAKFLTRFLTPPPPSGPDFDRRARPPATQTATQWLAFLRSDAGAQLGELNLSLRPGDEAPIGLFDVGPDGRGRRFASLVGLMTEDYDDLKRQPLPLGGLDAPDLELRELQADWVRLYADRLTQASRRIYGRNARAQAWITGIAAAAVTLSAAAPFSILGHALPFATVMAVGAAAPVVTGLPAWAIYALNRRHRHLERKDLHDDFAAKSIAVAALTRGRQDNLIALIDALFDGAGHLHEDVAEIELTADTARQVGLIFALHGLLCANRRLTRWHLRLLGMAHDSLSIFNLDQALMKRRRLGKLANLGLRRITVALGILGLAALPALAPMFAVPTLPAAISVASAGLTLGVAATAMLHIHATTNRVIDEEDLSQMCAEAVFAATPGPAQVRLELKISQLTGRMIVRLLREAHKHH